MYRYEKAEGVMRHMYYYRRPGWHGPILSLYTVENVLEYSEGGSKHEAKLVGRG